MPKVRFTPGRGMGGYGGQDIGTGEPVQCTGPSVIEVSAPMAEYLCTTFPNFTPEKVAAKIDEKKDAETPPEPDPPRVSRFKRRSRKGF